MIDAVHRYDGYVVQSTGDGIFALFGAPIAHEDHPQRALYAALRMQDELRRYSAKLVADGGNPFQCRVGTNTGEVVVRSITTGQGHTEYTPIGHTTNLASRMQAVAPVGSIAVAESTRKLCEGYFSLKPLGPTRVKGIAEAVSVYEVTGLGPIRTRLQRAGGRGYTKFVGREREMDAMKHAAEQAKAGHGQIVAAIAEPGLGKSRLFYEFKAKNQSGWMVLEAYSLSHGKASAYLPVIDLLHGYFKISSDDDPCARREKVNDKVLTLDRSLEGTVHYLFALLGIIEGDDPTTGMDAQVRRRRTLDAIKRLLLRESLNQPLIVIFEDLQWIDEETQALLNLLADSIGTAKILLLVNYRPEYRQEWSSKTYYTQLRLDPLGRESADEMLVARLGDGGDLVPLMRLIIDKTEGNPFFMEETVDMLLDEGALVHNGSIKLIKPLAELKIPPTVQAILASRIDRLPRDEKELLQTLAVIGREFSFRLVRQVIGPHPRASSALDPLPGEGMETAGREAAEDLQKTLGDLQLAEFIYEQPAVGDVEYTFKHALTQEVAYNSILIDRRKAIHARTGAAIETAFASRLDDHIDELLNHFSRGGDTRKTALYMTLGAQQALERFAFSEAIRRTAAALELLRTMKEGRERDELELMVRMVRAEAIEASSTQAADPAVLEAYSRARELCLKAGTVEQSISVLWGLQRFYQLQSRPKIARPFAEEMVTVAERTDNQPLIRMVRSRLAHNLALVGELERARSLFEDSAVQFDSDQGLPEDDRMRTLRLLARVLWFLGFPTQAARRNEESIGLFHSGTRALSPYCLVVPASNTILLRDWKRTFELTDELDALASEHQMPYFRDFAQRLRGAASIERGQIEDGLALVDLYLRAADLKGARVSEYWHFLVPTARAYGRCGRARYGLRLIEEALSDSATSGQSLFDSEYQRAKGELLLVEPVRDAELAEASFKQAIEIARGQRAKMPELRATMSLARLLANQSKRDEARAMLADIYDWFTEGFDTADLREARALLAELSA
jgi:hypothetical protein